MNKLQSAQDVRTCISVFDEMGLRPHWSGLCVWIENQPTDAQQVELVQVFGARWSEKRGQWYLRADESVRDEMKRG